MNTLIIVPILIFGICLLLGMLWKNGDLPSLNKQVKWKRGGLRLMPGTYRGKEYVPRKYEGILLVVFAYCMYKVAFKFAGYLFLCYLFGFSRVQNESLRIVTTPKGHPWVISNGDQIETGLQPIHYFICVVVWILITIIGFVIIRRLLPKQKRS